MDHSKIIKRNDNRFLTSDLGEEVVMMDLESGEYIAMNPLATQIWQLLTTPATADGLIEKLLSMYAVERERCEAETIRFLTWAVDRSILLSE